MDEREKWSGKGEEGWMYCIEDVGRDNGCRMWGVEGYVQLCATNSQQSSHNAVLLTLLPRPFP